MQFWRRRRRRRRIRRRSRRRIIVYLVLKNINKLISITEKDNAINEMNKNCKLAGTADIYYV